MEKTLMTDLRTPHFNHWRRYCRLQIPPTTRRSPCSWLPVGIPSAGSPIAVVDIGASPDWNPRLQPPTKRVRKKCFSSSSPLPLTLKRASSTP